jgi:hypothetical protein
MYETTFDDPGEDATRLLKTHSDNERALVAVDTQLDELQAERKRLCGVLGDIVTSGQYLLEVHGPELGSELREELVKELDLHVLQSHRQQGENQV